MKRSAEAVTSISCKRARPDPQAISDAFKPDQKRKAKDVCAKGADGIGYIEGKVYERGIPSADGWEFLITVELGSRVQVLLSGPCSRHFGEMPIAVGAQVRIGTRGLSLEDLNGKPRALLLPKRFAWREGVQMHIINPKTAEVAFIDVWTASHQPDGRPAAYTSANERDPEDMDAISTPAILDGGGPTAIPTGKAIAPTGRPRSSSPQRLDDSIGKSGGEAPGSPAHNMVIDNAEPGQPSEVDASTGQANSGSSQSDSQNPQSLPSPPPELSQGHPTDVHGKGYNSSPPMQPGVVPPENPDGATQSPRNLAGPASKPERKMSVGSAGQTREKPSTSDAGPSRVAPRRAKDGKKTTSRHRRKLKQLAKAEKPVDEASPNAPAADPQRVNEDPDGEEDYWDGADTLPEEAFLDDTAQEQIQSGEGQLRSASSGPGPHIADASVSPQPEQSHEDYSSANEHLTESVDDRDPLESLKRGCVAGFVAYTPLVKFQGAGTRHVMGVVDSPGQITHTRTSEIMMRLVLYDPTNYGTSGLNVTLFEKSEKALPKLEAGDVLMLRSVQVDKFGGFCATGASYKGWQWAVFHVKTGMLSSAPADTCALRHFKPEESELQFSIRLGDWWRDVSSTATSFDVSISTISRRGGRAHKPISEAGNDEYFDCTVEVLHGFRNENGVYTVFVTDYTRNPNMSPTQGEWCPPRLAPYALRIEMWDSSAQVGPTMQAGEYYSIRNLRTRISGGGFVEGKMQEGEKITKLDEDQLENAPRLAELLKRKAEWEAEMNATGGVHEFPHQVIEEAEENRHFKCTVEVVHVSPKDDFTYLYVTDYTARPDLVPVSASIAPVALVDRVVRVELRDAQVDTAKNLEAGDYVAIRNLRLRPSGGGTRLAGRLGGDQRLITKLNPKASGNADLRALLNRKEEWTASQSKTKREGKRTAARAARHAAAAAEGDASRVPVSRKGKGKARGKAVTTLEEVKESESCPAVFRVRARVIDFFPDDLRDCTVLRCTSCDETLPKTRRRCTKCDDAMEDETAVAAFFQLWFRIADAEGTTLDVSIADERCSILQDLSPDDVHEDDDAFSMLVARVKPLLGPLLEVRDGEARRRPVVQDEGEGAPLLDLTIGSWLPEGVADTPDGRAYVVLKHALCEDE
ncbi:hypothetical protein BV20DRAFT_849182 [Pilatotrama ljubarskyi]|nr:hypothetical protein BV20DRAFT_849182 [Pilatotrama ljubarskyi]